MMTTKETTLPLQNWYMVRDAGGEIIGYYCPECAFHKRVDIPDGYETAPAEDISGMAIWCFACGKSPNVEEDNR